MSRPTLAVLLLISLLGSPGRGESKSPAPLFRWPAPLRVVDPASALHRFPSDRPLPVTTGPAEPTGSLLRLSRKELVRFPLNGAPATVLRADHHLTLTASAGEAGRYSFGVVEARSYGMRRSPLRDHDPFQGTGPQGTQSFHRFDPSTGRTSRILAIRGNQLGDLEKCELPTGWSQRLDRTIVVAHPRGGPPLSHRDHLLEITPDGPVTRLLPDSLPGVPGSRISRYCISPDGRKAAGVVRRPHSIPYTAPDGARELTTETEEPVILDLDSGTVSPIPTDHPRSATTVMEIHWSPRGRWLGVRRRIHPPLPLRCELWKASDHSINTWSGNGNQLVLFGGASAALELVVPPPSPRSFLHAFGFSPDEKHLVVWERDLGTLEDGELMGAYLLTPGSPGALRLTPPATVADRVDWSPGGRRLFVQLGPDGERRRRLDEERERKAVEGWGDGSNSSRLRVEEGYWLDVEKGQVLLDFPETRLLDAIVSPEDGWLAVQLEIRPAGTPAIEVRPLAHRWPPEDVRLHFLEVRSGRIVRCDAVSPEGMGRLVDWLP